MPVRQKRRPSRITRDERRFTTSRRLRAAGCASLATRADLRRGREQLALRARVSEQAHRALELRVVRDGAAERGGVAEAHRRDAALEIAIDQLARRIELRSRELYARTRQARVDGVTPGLRDGEVRGDLALLLEGRAVQDEIALLRLRRERLEERLLRVGDRVRRDDHVGRDPAAAVHHATAIGLERR